jgi:hypothetical protein
LHVFGVDGKDLLARLRLGLLGKSRWHQAVGGQQQEQRGNQD